MGHVSARTHHRCLHARPPPASRRGGGHRRRVVPCERGEVTRRWSRTEDLTAARSWPGVRISAWPQLRTSGWPLTRRAARPGLRRRCHSESSMDRQCCQRRHHAEMRKHFGPVDTAKYFCAPTFHDSSADPVRTARNWFINIPDYGTPGGGRHHSGQVLVAVTLNSRPCTAGCSMLTCMLGWKTQLSPGRERCCYCRDHGRSPRSRNRVTAPAMLSSRDR